MPSKRKPLTFPELEPAVQPKGRGAILRTSEEVAAEERMLENQDAGMPPTRLTASATS